MGFPGLPRSHADYYAYAQATHILGRMGLMGRLGDRVRDRMGLAYYVHASAPSDPTGDLWTIHAGVNPANVEKAIAAIMEELARIRSEEVSQPEFSDCQTNLIGGSRISLEGCGQVAGALASVEFLRLGLDYFDRYEEYVRSVNKAGILDAARRHFREEGCAVVVAG
jgi:zinc protease